MRLKEASICAMYKGAGFRCHQTCTGCRTDGIAWSVQPITHLDGEVVGGVLCLHTPRRHHQLAIGPSIVQHHFIALTVFQTIALTAWWSWQLCSRQTHVMPHQWHFLVVTRGLSLGCPALLVIS